MSEIKVVPCPKNTNGEHLFSFLSGYCECGLQISKVPAVETRPHAPQPDANCETLPNGDCVSKKKRLDIEAIARAVAVPEPAAQTFSRCRQCDCIMWKVRKNAISSFEFCPNCSSEKDDKLVQNAGAKEE